jgi:hypothetical protein
MCLGGVVRSGFRDVGDFDKSGCERVGAAADAGAKVAVACSRARLIAIWTIIAAIGARMSISSDPITPSPLLLLSRLPPKAPKNMPSCASMDTAPAMVAVIVIVSVS